VDEAGVKWFATSSELAEWFKDNPVDEAVILIKGSRGTRMEKVLEVL
jgi:UDP-N-acetylmuramyl pentapeptide synthase